MNSMLVTLPVIPGQADAARAFTKECLGARREEYDASERRIGIPKENWYLQHTPAGDMFLIFVEGDDLMASLGAFIQSREPFDLWFKERLRAVTGADLNAGPPPAEAIAETLGEYQAD